MQTEQNPSIRHIGMMCQDSVTAPIWIFLNLPGEYTEVSNFVIVGVNMEYRS